MCLRRFRRWWLAQTTLLLENSHNLTAVSLVLAGWQLPVGRLHEFDIKRYRKTLHRRLNEAVGDKLVVGSLDLSVRVTGLFDFANWSAHAELIVADADGEEIEAALRKATKKTEEVPRPLVVKPVAEPPHTFSNAINPRIKRRRGYADRKGRLRTKKVGLKATERREAAIVLDGVRPEDLLILRGVQLRDGRLVCNAGAAGHTHTATGTATARRNRKR